MAVTARPPGRATYGIDAPNILIGLVASSLFLLLLGFFFAGGRARDWSLVPWCLSGVLALAAWWVANGTLRAKPAFWRRTLDGLGLTGAEQALDLGCGRGLVLVAVARRLPEGHATGVDIWRNRDQSGNRRITTELNARIEGVADRVTVRDADITRLPFPDASFDLVTASFTIRSLALADERRRALGEAARVLRPGGRLVVLDDAHTAELAGALDRLGFEAVRRSGPLLAFGPPARSISATRR